MSGAARARVGIVGCGVISRRYAANAGAFDSYEVVACTDLDRARRDALAREFGLASSAPEDLLADPDVDVVLNLTPAGAHVPVTRAALEAGKHVYSEKPIAVETADAEALLALADARGLRLGCAPDTFLGGAAQSARALIDRGAIGVPLGVSAAMLAGGQERWHPDPDIFYEDGAGPLLDMGPYYLTAIVALLGPVRRVAGVASTTAAEWTIEIGPRAGERFAARTPTRTAALLELDGGCTATLVATFEAPGNSSSTLIVHGSDGTLALPDPNLFDGPILLRRGRSDWDEVPHPARGDRDARGIGLHDMVESTAAGRAHRASGELALHVLDVARSILSAAETGTTTPIASTVARPEALPAEDVLAT